MKRNYLEKELDLRNQNIKNSIRGMKLSAIVCRFRECVKNNQSPTIEDWKQMNNLYRDMLPFFEDMLRDKAGELREEEWVAFHLRCGKFVVPEVDGLAEL